MPRHAVSMRAATILVLSCLLGALATPATAQADPPVVSPLDAACREQAKARVFSVPDPLNLGLREIGRQIYAACMKRTVRPAVKRRPHRLHRYRRR